MAETVPANRGAHPTPWTYFKVATLLVTLTAIEVGVFYVDSLKPAFVLIFLLLSFAKFSLVVMFYMHLRYDSRLFSGFFVGGLLLAVSVGVTVMALFQVLSANAGPPPPTVNTVSPASGPTAGGTAVTISGGNFVSGATVAFGGKPATNVTYVSRTTLTAETPAHDVGAVDVVVTNPDQDGDIQSDTLPGGYTYGPTPSSVSPTCGPTRGSTTVTISGTGFVSGVTVDFGGKPTTNVTFVSSTTLKGETPAHAEGAVDVVVTNPGGESGTLLDGYTYGLTFGSVLPASGPTEGGTTVAISGTCFVSGTTVTFDGTPATNVIFVNSTTLRGETTAHAEGDVDVVVTTSDGRSRTLFGGYTYGDLGSPPTVSTVSPASGPTAGGTAVTISGENFVSGATLTFGGKPATNVTFVRSTTLRGQTPSHEQGAVDVVLTNPDSQSVTLSDGFKYDSADHAELGKELFLNPPVNVGVQPLWCSTCHTIEGISGGLIGPDLTNIGADAATRIEGMSAEKYIRESIKDPEAFICQGLERATARLMTKDTVGGLTDAQVDALVAFLLAQKPGPPEPAQC